MRSKNPILDADFADVEVDVGSFRWETDTSEPMTFTGVLNRSLLLFVPLLVAAVAAFRLPEPHPLTLLAAIGVTFGLIWLIQNPIGPHPVALLAYAVAQGFLLGFASKIAEQEYPGIVSQVVFATLATATTLLLLYRFKVVRASSTLTKVFLVGFVGFVLFFVIHLTLFITNPEAESSVTSLAFTFLLGGLGAVLASVMLVSDFTYIEHGVRGKVPRQHEWQAAFGLMFSLVWLYLQVLQLFSVVRRFSD